MVKPICPKCGADSSKFLTWMQVTVAGTVNLLYCNSCGSVLGIINKTI